MVPGGARSYKVVLGGIRWYQVVPCQVGPGCFEMVPGVRMMIRVVIRMMTVSYTHLTLPTNREV